MDKEPDMVYDQVNTTLETSFHHQVILLNTAGIIDNIMTDDTVDIATL